MLKGFEELVLKIGFWAFLIGFADRDDNLSPTIALSMDVEMARESGVTSGCDHRKTFTCPLKRKNN
jgi:hypothetical protein